MSEDQENVVDDTATSDSINTDTSDKSKVKGKRGRKPAAEKDNKPEIEFVRYKNITDRTISVHGMTLRPGELSRSLTKDQARLLEGNFGHIFGPGYLIKVSA